MARTNALLTTTDDLRHTWEQVAWGRQVTGNNVEPAASPFGPWTPPEPAQATPEPGLDGEVLGPDAPASGPYHSAQLEGQIIEGEGGTVHDHADLYGSIWGDGSAPQIEAPEIEAPAIAPPEQGDDLTPGY